jgi:hypothetical protein
MKKLIYAMSVLIILQACSMSKDDSGNEVIVGEGGSLARFSIVNDHLYIVGESSLNTYELQQGNLPPVLKNTLDLGFGSETIFPYDEHLLLGTQDGMYVMDISTPSNPKKVTLFQHIRSCDPVVAENGFAYITLNASNQQCWRGLNELQIVDIHDLTQPFIKKTYAMVSPSGLDIHSDTLFVCDNGLKVLDVSDKTNPVQIQHFTDISARDVIYFNGRLLLIGDDGFHQYTVSPAGITELSNIPVEP